MYRNSIYKYCVCRVKCLSEKCGIIYTTQDCTVKLNYLLMHTAKLLENRIAIKELIYKKKLILVIIDLLNFFFCQTQSTQIHFTSSALLLH